jgi:hypothetical protein
MKEKEENLTWKQSNPNRNCLTLPRCTACDLSPSPLNRTERMGEPPFRTLSFV